MAAGKTLAERRAERQAAALRANLLRRKAQARERSGEGEEQEVPPGTEGSGEPDA
jgi:hypothetical protein